MEDAAIPLPNEESTPPVTNIYFTFFLPDFFFKDSPYKKTNNKSLLTSILSSIGGEEETPSPSEEHTQCERLDAEILYFCKALLLEGRAGLLFSVVAQAFQPVP